MKTNSIFTRGLILSLAFLILSVALVCAFVKEDDMPVADAAVLKQGSKGDLVKTVQTKLIKWGYLSGKADGIYGAKTKAAVIKFQRKNGLAADGIIGTRTAQALGISLSSGTS